ncbi:MAG TPA: type IV pilin [Candidatus Thermoplasmatota archaeon]|nr:type IV pilin [Candidatus Thermoplasmatota archaeon]
MTDGGAVETVGTLLLVAITVAAAAVFGAFLHARLVVETPPHADVSTGIARGPDAVWNTADDQLRITHGGGERLPASRVVVVYAVDGLTTRLTGSALGSAFSDGSLTAGETWTRTLRLAPGARVSIQVSATSEDGTSRLLANAIYTVG